MEIRSLNQPQRDTPTAETVLASHVAVTHPRGGKTERKFHSPSMKGSTAFPPSDLHPRPPVHRSGSGRCGGTIHVVGYGTPKGHFPFVLLCLREMQARGCSLCAEWMREQPRTQIREAEYLPPMRHFGTTSPPMMQLVGIFGNAQSP